MSDEPTRFPLQWPIGWKRTASRRVAKFRKGAERLSIADAIGRLKGELRRLGVYDRAWLISSNVPTRLDGLPYAGAPQPADPGVAVYFRMGAKREPKVLACDRWTRVADNIAAIAGHIEAIRAQERYGVGSLEQAFAGYTAIPQKTGGADWRAEMGFQPNEQVSLDAMETRYRELARQRHPDSGGSHEAMARLNEARAAARAEAK